MVIRTIATAAAVLMLTVSAQAGELKSSLKKGKPDIQSAGPLTFGPEGILFVGDPQSASIFALDTEDAGKKAGGELNIEGINVSVASALGTQPQQILINDLAVNPASGKAYLSVSRGRGPKAQPVLLSLEEDGTLSALSLDKIKYSQAKLPNAPAEKGKGRRNQRRQSITDLKYVDGRLIVAGLSNEEFASKLRSIPFPFSKVNSGTSVEIFHGAHGRFETRSPVRTFIPYDITGETHLLAAYTCTPLVKFPLKNLKPGNKVKGTTVAELGNRNRPLDMVAYKKGGKNYILMANSSRGLMKIRTEGVDTTESIEKKIKGTAGLSYDVIPGMDGVVQLDRLNDRQAVVILQQEDGRQDLKTIDLP